MFCSYCGIKLVQIDNGFSLFYRCPRWGSFWRKLLLGDNVFAHDSLVNEKRREPIFDRQTGKRLD